MAKRQAQRKARKSVREIDHERGDHIPSHPGFAARYRKAKGGTLEDAQQAEQALEKRVATANGVTDPARVSGDVMAQAKERYLQSVEE